jgi:hypothetical protein
MPTPPASLWEQYSVVGILILVLGLAVIAIWRAFREYRSWQSKESSDQRIWQSGENQKREFEVANRDEAYRKFFIDMEQKRTEGAVVTTTILKQLTENMTALSHKLDRHDENVDKRVDAAKKEIVNALVSTRRKK